MKKFLKSGMIMLLILVLHHLFFKYYDRATYNFQVDLLFANRKKDLRIAIYFIAWFKYALYAGYFLIPAVWIFHMKNKEEE